MRPGRDNISEIVNHGEIDDPVATRVREKWFKEFLDEYKKRAQVALEAHEERVKTRPLELEPTEACPHNPEEQIVVLKGGIRISFVNGETLVARQSAADTAWLISQEVDDDAKMLEIGSGSGVWGVAYMKAKPKRSYWGIDIDEKALRRTRRNFDLNNIDPERIHIQWGDVLELLDLEAIFSDVYSNPPYDRAAEAAKREGHIGPKHATYGGEDGLKIYRAVLEQSPRLLKDGRGKVHLRSPANLLLSVALEARRILDSINQRANARFLPASFYRAPHDRTLPSGVSFAVGG